MAKNQRKPIRGEKYCTLTTRGDKMGIEEEIQEKVTKVLEAEHVACTDISGGSSCDDGYKLELIVVSPKFEGVPLLKRHRMVNDVLADDMSRIHALSMKTWTPAQYESKK